MMRLRLVDPWIASTRGSEGNETTGNVTIRAPSVKIDSASSSSVSWYLYNNSRMPVDSHRQH